jgi:phosphate acyltransferase
MKNNGKTICLALDVMGGEKGVKAAIEGAALSGKIKEDIFFYLCGDKVKISKYLNKFPKLLANSEIIHTDEVISSTEKPSIALRKGKNSSMAHAIKLVKEQKADAIISSGNTGALMAMSKIMLRPLEGIDRPAIVAIIPTIKDKSVMLDLGANASCDATNLVQFAIMGDVYAKAMLEKKSPSIGILNIGSEDVKGNDVVRVAHQMIQEDFPELNYFGYVEGDDIAKGTTDIIVTDGFNGNITLKTIEGTAKFCRHLMERGFKKTLFAKLGYMISQRSLKRTFKLIDPRNYNGAMFIGLNGISIKSHGNSDEVGIASAIRAACQLHNNNINEKIKTLLKSHV